jgi:hypothetical protein
VNYHPPSIVFSYPIKMTDQPQTQYTQFLYVVLKERYVWSKAERTDNHMRIVHWKEEWGTDYTDQFVVYGKRPNSKRHGEYIAYRLKFSTKEQVEQFIKMIVTSSENRVTIELHQFSGLNDDSEDGYNIDWQNTPENETTELVAFEIDSRSLASGEIVTNYIQTLDNVLTILENGEAV